MLSEHPNAATFSAIKRWAAIAQNLSASEAPDPAPLYKKLPEGARSILRADTSLHEDRTIIGFDLKGQGNIGVKTRHVLPVHFATLRLLDLVPRTRLFLKDDPHKNRPKKGGRLPTPDDYIFHLSLSISEGLAEKLGIPEILKVDRILFNAPPDATLSERRTGDYRYIVPSGSVPIRHRGDPMFTQDSLLAAIDGLVAAAPNDSPAPAEEIVDLLTLLFEIGDRWHWHELIDRIIENDPCRGSVKA